MATKKVNDLTRKYCFITKGSNGEEVIQGPTEGLEATKDNSLGWYGDDDVFEIFELVSVGRFQSRTTTKFIKRQ